MKKHTGHHGPLVYITKSSAENCQQIIFHKEQKRSGNPKVVPGKKNKKKKQRLKTHPTSYTRINFSSIKETSNVNNETSEVQEQTMRIFKNKIRRVNCDPNP